MGGAIQDDCNIYISIELDMILKLVDVKKVYGMWLEVYIRFDYANERVLCSEIFN